MTTSVLVVPGSLRDAAVTSQIASLTVAVTVAGVTVALAGGLGLMPLYSEDIDAPVPPGSRSPEDRGRPEGSGKSIAVINSATAPTSCWQLELQERGS